MYFFPNVSPLVALKNHIETGILTGDWDAPRIKSIIDIIERHNTSCF